jgi:Spx/MgsR family transcriptional regulator
MVFVDVLAMTCHLDAVPMVAAILVGAGPGKLAIMIVYGIANCDTVKRARAWLDERGAAYAFHDFKKAGVPMQRLDTWLESAGWETLLNRRGTTWRKLDAAVQAHVTGAASARALMLTQPSVIKRPVVEWGDGQISVGFDAAQWSEESRHPAIAREDRRVK